MRLSLASITELTTDFEQPPQAALFPDQSPELGTTDDGMDSLLL